MNKIIVTTKTELDALYNCSALTWEGLSTDTENLESVIDWLKVHNAETEEVTFHIIKGELMNEIYGLTGTNAYPDDLDIVSVTGIKQEKIIFARFEVGGRWFDDIVDNNRMREEEN